MTLSDFIQRIGKIAEWVDAHVRTKKPEVRADISKAIDTAIGHHSQAVQYILSDKFQTKKTPLYFAHVRDLSPKNRMRKQNFLALYDYLKSLQKYYRSQRTGVYSQDVELRIWIYTTEPRITEKELDAMWEKSKRIILAATPRKNRRRLAHLLEMLSIGDELNEEIDKDEMGNEDVWEGTLTFFDELQDYVYDAFTGHRIL